MFDSLTSFSLPMHALAGHIKRVGKTLNVTNAESKKLVLILAEDINTKGPILITEEYIKSILHQVRP